MVKIVDSFLFSEAYEKELLLTKLELESPVVDEFVLIESDVTFRGDYKGFQAEAMIQSDDRFKPFLSKIHLVQNRGRLCEGPQIYSVMYENEERSRESCWSYLESHYSNDDWVIVSDVDECVDCTDPTRRDAFLAHLQENQGKTVRFQHLRYWHDFDSLSKYLGVVTPVTQIGLIKKEWSSLRCRSRPAGKNELIPISKSLCFFEYTFAFAREFQWRKLNSFIHDGYTEEELDVALATNSWVKSAARGESLSVHKEDDWFEIVGLTPANSPKYVRENLERLKVGAIATNYKENRKRLFGI